MFLCLFKLIFFFFVFSLKKECTKKTASLTGLSRLRSVLGVVEEYSSGNCEGGKSEEENNNDEPSSPMIAESPLQMKIEGVVAAGHLTNTSASIEAGYDAGLILGDLILILCGLVVFPLANVGYNKFLLVTKKSSSSNKRKHNNNNDNKEDQDDSDDDDDGRSNKKHQKLSLKRLLANSKAMFVIVFALTLFMSPMITSTIKIIVGPNIRFAWRLLALFVILLFLISCFGYCYWALFRRDPRPEKFVGIKQDLTKVGSERKRRTTNNEDVEETVSFVEYLKKTCTTWWNLLNVFVGPEGEWMWRNPNHEQLKQQNSNKNNLHGDHRKQQQQTFSNRKFSNAQLDDSKVA